MSPNTPNVGLPTEAASPDEGEAAEAVPANRPEGEGDRAEQAHPEVEATRLAFQVVVDLNDVVVVTCYFFVDTFLRVVIMTDAPFFVTNSSGRHTLVPSPFIHIFKMSPSMA